MNKKKTITNKRLANIDLLIFDLDGTLLKSNKVNFEAFKKGLTDMKWKVSLTQAKMDRLMGEPSESVYRQILPADKLPRKEELRKRIREYYAPMITKYGQAFPGVLETLEALKNRGYKLALYSYASTGYFDSAIEKLGIGEYFDYMECVQKNGLTKIELVEKIKKRFPKLKAAVIGDSIHDIDVARQTGSISVGVCYGYGGKEMSRADMTIDSIAELLDIFDRRRPIFEKIETAINERKNKNRAFVVGVNGIDTSGKTEFAKGLERFLRSEKRNVQVINLDDFHNPKAIRYSGKDQAENYYTKSFNIEAILDNLLKPARAKGRVAVSFTALNVLTDKYETKRHYEFGRDSIIIFEGVFIFRKELAPHIDYKIFIDIPFAESKRRAEKRDVPVYGQTVLIKYDEKYLPAQKKYLVDYPPERIADMIIDNTDWNAPIVKGISEPRWC